MVCVSVLELTQFQFSTDTISNLSVIVDNDRIITDRHTTAALINLNLMENKEWKTTIRLFYSSGLVVNITDQLKLSKML